jgi:hypothetical protein
MEEAVRPWVWRDGQVGVGGAVAEEMGKFQGTYKDFFKGLSFERQVEIIGPSRARALADGEIDFDDLTTYRGEIKNLDELGVKERRK